MQDPPAIAIRMADQADIDALCASASAGEAAAIDFDGKLVAVADEYGTVTTAPGLAHLAIELEKMLDHATEVWPVPASRKYDPSQKRGWVLVEHWSDEEGNIVNIHGPYDRPPTQEDIHFAVIDILDRQLGDFMLAGGSKSGHHYNEADLPDHVHLLRAQLGTSFEL